MTRILLYSHDTFGLGNIRRMTEIARHLVASDANCSVLILTGSPMLHAFRIPPRIDYVKLPCLARTRSGDYAVKFLSLHYQDTVNLRASLIAATVREFAPDLILVDKKPTGVGGELAPAIEALATGSSRPKLVLLLRDILDEPAATIPVWRRNGYFDVIERHYDEVLVVGSPEIFDPRHEYAFPPGCAAKVRFCGYIDRKAGRPDRIAVRAELGLASAPLVLVCAGGGADGYELMATYLDGLDAACEFDSLIVCGPEMGAAERERIHTGARRHARVIVRDFCEDMTGTIAAADAVVCMGGYNTVCEVLALKRRAVVVPRVRPVAEQWIRAERLARLGLLTALHPDRLSPRTLIDAVQAELARDNVVPHRGVDFGGLERIGASIRALLDHAAPLRRIAAS